MRVNHFFSSKPAITNTWAFSGSSVSIMGRPPIGDYKSFPENIYRFAPESPDVITLDVCTRAIFFLCVPLVKNVSIVAFLAFGMFGPLDTTKASFVQWINALNA